MFIQDLDSVAKHWLKNSSKGHLTTHSGRPFRKTSGEPNKWVATPLDIIFFFRTVISGRSKAEKSSQVSTRSCANAEKRCKEQWKGSGAGAA